MSETHGFVARASRAEAGRARRIDTPRSAHSAYEPDADRPDPVGILQEQAKERLQDLLPYRYGRMAVSPFTFLRGAAAVMALDLSRTPSSGIRTQVLGDCHLSNFGFFGTPERTLVFDVNDFDETLPAPFEWDLKRLGASFVVAARGNGFSDPECRAATMECMRGYRDTMQELAEMRTMDVWYMKIEADDLLAYFTPGTKQRKRAERFLEKTRSRDSLRAEGKLTTVIDGKRRFLDDPPLLVRAEEPQVVQRVTEALKEMRRSLQDDRRTLLDRFRYIDVARKVVGVGSVGTRCFVLLFQGPGTEEEADGGDPLILQFKEATSSVLEPYAGRSRQRNHGQRVVDGQRLMQAASDIFLGWIKGGIPGVDSDFYFRQLHDMKGSIDPATVKPSGLELYGRLCGRTLARAHARAGDAPMIAGYIGPGDVFPLALTDFSERYADQTEQDHAALLAAIDEGRVESADDPVS